MNNSIEAKYFKIGTFILIGFGLIIFAVLVFGSGTLFQRVVYLETYFDESIEGVSVGSPVKYRGLQIGHIEEINFMNEPYTDKSNTDNLIRNRSIYVKLAITSKLFTELSHEKLEALLNAEIANGLRAKIIVQGLTGVCHIGLDYVNNATNYQNSSILDRESDCFYIPAAKSTLTSLSENTQNIIARLSKADFSKVFKNMSLFLESITRVTSRVETLFGRTSSSLETTLQNLKIISDNMRIVTDQLKLNPSVMIFGKPIPPIDLTKL
jgi:paraquat-inducible protein B